MTLKYIVIGTIVMTLLSSAATVPTAFASQDPNRELTEYEKESGFFNEDGYINTAQFTRPPINPDFDPDESCQFDAFQLKCVPGSEQECPEGYGQNGDSTCIPRGPCPEGYHHEDDDETGQCYLDSEGCSSDSYVLREREDGNGMTCSSLGYICDDEEHRERNYCIEYCNENPDSFACRPEVN